MTRPGGWGERTKRAAPVLTVNYNKRIKRKPSAILAVSPRTKGAKSRWEKG